MANQFSSGKNAVAFCDRCGFRFKLTELRKEIVKTKQNNLLVCDRCWDPDQPQLLLGMTPISDPQAVRDPRPDLTYPESRSWIETINVGVATQWVVGRVTVA